MFDLLHSLKPVSSDICACKICSGRAPLYGVVDFHRACDIAHGAQLPLSGVPIYYRRCEGCGFLYTDAFDNWDITQFKTAFTTMNTSLLIRIMRLSVHEAMLAS